MAPAKLRKSKPQWLQHSPSQAVAARKPRARKLKQPSPKLNGPVAKVHEISARAVQAATIPSRANGKTQLSSCKLNGPAPKLSAPSPIHTSNAGANRNWGRTKPLKIQVRATISRGSQISPRPNLRRSKAHCFEAAHNHTASETKLTRPRPNKRIRPGIK